MTGRQRTSASPWPCQIRRYLVEPVKGVGYNRWGCLDVPSPRPNTPRLLLLNPNPVTVSPLLTAGAQTDTCSCVCGVCRRASTPRSIPPSRQYRAVLMNTGQLACECHQVFVRPGLTPAAVRLWFEAGGLFAAAQHHIPIDKPSTPPHGKARASPGCGPCTAGELFDPMCIVDLPRPCYCTVSNVKVFLCTNCHSPHLSSVQLDFTCCHKHMRLHH